MISQHSSKNPTHVGHETPAYCLRFAHPAEANRTLEARKMENLHLVTEWNDNGMECNANGIEWNGMEWNGMKSFVQNRCKIRQKRSPGLSKFECGSLAIRGRRGVTRHDLGKYSVFFDISAQPTWERSLEDWRNVSEATCQKTSESFEKSSPEPPKSSPGASKIEPGAVQDTIFKRPIT